MLLIPGFPDPSKEDIETFQANNRCKVDGIVGPQTRGAIWPEEGDEYFAVRLAPYVYRHDGATQSIDYARMMLQSFESRGKLPLSAERMMTLFRIVSSRWSCGFDWLTGEDGLTIGFRRFASTKAASLMKRYQGDCGGGFRDCFGPLGRIMALNNEDAPNNGGLVGEAYVRAGLMELQKRHSWWLCQIQFTLEDWAEDIFDRYPGWRLGRLFGLAVRAFNSGTSYLDGLPDDDSAYEVLKADYTDVSERKRKNRRKRIRDIERIIPDGPWK